MNTDFKVDGAGLWDAVKSRKVVLENKHHKLIFDIPLVWFIVIAIIASSLVILGLVIALFMQCKLSVAVKEEKQQDQDGEVDSSYLDK